MEETSNMSSTSFASELVLKLVNHRSLEVTCEGIATKLPIRKDNYPIECFPISMLILMCHEDVHNRYKWTRLAIEYHDNQALLKRKITDFWHWGVCCCGTKRVHFFGQKTIGKAYEFCINCTLNILSGIWFVSQRPKQNKGIYAY